MSEGNEMATTVSFAGEAPLLKSASLVPEPMAGTKANCIACGNALIPEQRCTREEACNYGWHHKDCHGM